MPIPNLNNIEDHFGTAVAIDDNYAVVGASQFQPVRGYANDLYYNGSNWEIVAKLTPSDSEIVFGYNNIFGLSISISGDYVVIGSINKAYVYEKPSTGWKDTIENAQLYGSNTYNNSNFGNSVCISGNYIAIDAYGVDTTQSATLRPSNIQYSSNFGLSASLSGENILIGAKLNNENGLESGSVYFYKMLETIWKDTTER